MKLSELLRFDDIVIQCHDNPDADALASGYALLWYFNQHNKAARFIYRGRNEVTKSNLKIMITELSIPVSYEPDFTDRPQLLVTVDCQPGQRNVTDTPADTVATIDHHQVTSSLPELSEVRSGVGSCATVIWDMIRDEGLDPDSDKLIATALYYGLFTDTNRLSEISHPLDRDMAEQLTVNKAVIRAMCNSNISLEELTLSGKAIFENYYNESNKYLVIRAEKCDPNILGVISDFALEADAVDVCVAYYTGDEEIKFSVRSCTKEVHANELASYISEGVGGGGGHIYKAGGTIRPELIADGRAEGYIDRRLIDYYDKYMVMYAKDMTLDTSTFKKYEKIPQELGVVSLKKVFPIDTHVEIRTMEGDITVTVTDDLYLMVGLAGEIYPIAEKKLRSSYFALGRPYSRTFEYAPTIKDVQSDEKKSVIDYAEAVISIGSTRIYAKPLDRPIKLFTEWDDEKYYYGDVGDYITVREDDPHDIYVVNRTMFDRLYKECD